MRKAARDRQRAEHDRDVVLAWQVERVNLTGYQKDGSRRLPDVMKLLGRPISRVARTPAEHRTWLQAMSASFGVPLKSLKKGVDGRYQLKRA